MKVLTFVLGALAMAHSSGLAAKNYANQLELQNCGGYVLDAVLLQGSKPNSDKWETVGCISYPANCDNGDGPINVGQAVCFDLTQFNDYDRFRFKASIGAGQTEKSDDTNYKEGADKRRVFRMKGTTYNNNRPNSRGYKAVKSSKECGAFGTKDKSVNCSNVSLQLDQPERRRG